MFRSLATAASGMEAQQTRLDVTANNIANVSTNGFKKGRAEFADLIYQTMRPAGAPTGNPLDVAIEGHGFLPVTMPSGETAYTRNGALQVNAEGRLVTADGYSITGDITIPTEAQAISIAANGTISVTLPGETQPVEVGKLQVAMFTNPAGLAAQGSTLFHETSASGTAVLGAPGDGGAGSIRQGMLEISNVNVVEEMIDLITGQRAYEINSRVIKAADEMLGETAQLR